MNDPMGRMLILGARVASGQPVTSRYIVETFGVSWAAAKRDMVRIESVLPVAATLTPTRCGGYMAEMKSLRLMVRP